MHSRPRPHRSRAFRVLLVAAPPLAAAWPILRATSSAATLYYDADRNGAAYGAGDTNANNVWNLSASNWYNPAPNLDQTWTDRNGTADTAVFDGAPGQVTLNSSLGALGLVFNAGGYTIVGRSALSLGAGGIAVYGNAGVSAPLSLVANQSWSVDPGVTLTVGGVISGAGFGFTKTGAGTVSLTVTNSYTGATTINQGVLASASAAASGTPFGTGGIALNAGALSIAPSGSNSNVSYTLASAAGSALTFGAGAQWTLDKGSETSLAVTLGASGAAANSALVAGANGTLIIAPGSGVGSLGTTIGEQVFLNGGATTTNGTLNGAVVLQDNDANQTGYFATYGSPYGLGTASATNTNFSAASPTNSATVEDVTAAASTNTRTVGALRASAAITVNGGQTLTVGNGANNAGVILNGGSIGGGALAFGGSRAIIYSSLAGGTINSPISGTAGVSFHGPGTTTLGGANTFTGGLFINGALVSITNDNQLGDPAGTITLNGGALRTTGTVALGGSGGNRMIVLNPGQANPGGVFSPISGTTTFTGASNNVISGPGSLTKTGGGTLVLTGTAANTFTGDTIVSAGTLNAASAGALGATASVTVGPRSTLSLTGASNDRINNAAPLILNGGTLLLNGTSESAGAGANGVGALTLNAGSTIDFGSPGSPNIIQFAGVHVTSESTQLRILNWDGTPGVANSGDRLLFAGSSSEFAFSFAQADVTFNGIAGYSMTDFSGYYEIYPVPEPATVLAGCLTVGALGWNRRRRLAALAALVAKRRIRRA